MKERLLFHLRLGDSSSPRLARRKSLIGAERASIWSSPSLLQDEGSGGTPEQEEPPLVCTCLHSSLSSTVAVGFKRGVVHVYHRKQVLDAYGRSRRGSEEEKWKRSVLYPTRSLGGAAASPIESPSSTLPPDITCVAIAPGGDRLAVGTSDGFVFVTQAPPPPNDAIHAGPGGGAGWARGAGFHHKSHRGKRINCLLWDKSGDQLYSVCEGGTVVLARNLQPRRGAPAVGVAGITGVMHFLGVHQPVQAASRREPVLPQAIIVGQAGSAGVSMDLGRTGAALPGAMRDYVECDVLLVMTRKRAVLLYFAVGEDVSAVAPHKTAVDLNVIEQPSPADTGGSPGSSSSGIGSPAPSPPSRADFGACLWGPPQLPCVGQNTLGGVGGAASRSTRGGDAAPDKLGNFSDEPLQAPRPVLFAYVAQPGGRLWRIGLADGEVESMHRPPVEIDEDIEEQGVAAEMGVELGLLRAVDVGDARALLCWRSGVDSKTGGEFALLDPNTHRFVAVFAGKSDIVDVSGFVLSPCSRSEGRAISLESAAARPITTRRSLEVLGGGVRVLHGGDLAKVTMLYHNAEGEEWSSCSSEVTDTLGAALSAEAAARIVQRAWRTAKQKRIAVTSAAAAAAAGPMRGDSPPADSPADSRVSSRVLRMPSEFSRVARAASSPSARTKRQHAASAGRAADSEAGGLQVEVPAEMSASSRRRKRQGRRSNRIPESLRAENGLDGGGGGGSGSRRKTSRSPFSVRDSIEALDAADRALQLSSYPGRSSNNPDEGQNEDTRQRWTNDRSSSGVTDVARGSNDAEGGPMDGAGGSGVMSSGSESDGAGAICRETDALIRETWPVLQRTRSLQDFSSFPDSPSFCKSPASFPPDSRSGARAAPAIGAVAAETIGNGREGQIGKQRGGEAAGALLVGDGGSGNDRWEDEEAEAEAFTAGGLSPGGSPFPSSLGWKDGNGEDGEPTRGHRSRSLSAHNASGFGTRSSSFKRSNTPFPRGQSGDRLGNGSESAPYQPARSSFPRQPPPKQARKKAPPGSQHGNLFGLGTLLQRSVQAMNHALQPGGGATSDDDSLGDGEDAAMFAGQQSGGSSGGGFSSGNDVNDAGDGDGADGGTTSETGKESWGASSDRSELDNSTATTMRLSSGANQDVDVDALLAGSRARRHTGGAGGLEGDGDDDARRNGEEGGTGHKRGRKMLFVSGMMGVKRHCLGTLRSRREARVRPNLAAVMDLPASPMDDPNPFVPPSQYEVRLNVSRGLGMSLNITGNSVRVKGFSAVQGAQIGPAQACGQIQVGDTLVCVNHERLSLLNHDNVVRVLRGLLNTSGSQVVLLRFAYAEDSQRLLQARSPPPPPPPLPPKTPKSISDSSPGNPKSEPRASHGARGSTGVGDEAFRPESWHGSRRPSAKDEGEPAAERDAARSESPSRTGGAARERSHSLGGDPQATLAKGRAGSGAGQGANAWGGGRGWGGWTVADGVGGMRPKGKRAGELWGERETRLANGDGGSRHVFLADMGQATAQKMLRSIAEDVQGLYEVRRSSEESRYFHGRSRPSFADPSPASLEYRIPPPSMLLAPPKIALSAPSSSGASTPHPDGLSASSARVETGGKEAPPPLPKELYRGRRRRRPRRRRSAFLGTALARGGGGTAGGGEGEEAEEEVSIDLLACQKVVQAEIGRLDGELERQRAKLARQRRRSTTRSLVARMLHKSCSSTGAEARSSSSGAFASTTARGGRDAGRRGQSRGYLYGAGAGTWRNGVAGLGSAGGGAWDEEGSDIALTDSDSSDLAPEAVEAAAEATVKTAARPHLGRQESAAGTGVESGQERVGDGDDGDEGVASSSVAEEEEGACDIFLEAVSTGGLQDELLDTHAVEVLGVDPPRPLPVAAYDLQTALESVQHFATQTLAGVVQSEATRGSDLYDPLSGARSPRQITGGWKAATAAAKENREAAAAAGAVQGWETAWPPRELTAALGLVTARQMAHAMRCDAEPLIQVWMRCFTPVNAKHRAKLWEGLSPPARNPGLDLDLGLNLEAGRWHRQLVCGIVTLFAQVHMSWPFLARPSDDPGAVGLLSLRLETTWFSSSTTGDAGTDAGVEAGRGDSAAGSPFSEGGVSTAGSFEEWGQASGGRQGPLQWDEEKAVDFIQDYGAYLEADALAAAASCREMEWALQEVLDLAQQCGDYKSKERALHQLLRGPRTPSTSALRSPMLRSPTLGTTPVVRSPTNSVGTAGTRTPGTWTPSMMSPRSPAFQSRPVLASGGAASAGKSGGGGGGGRGGLSGAFEAVASGPMEEDAVRKALGLPVAGSADRDRAAGVVGEDHRRHGDGSGDGGDGGGDFSGKGKREGGDGSHRFSETQRAPGGAPLCLLLRNLGELFRWDAAAAADICADAFPGVRPCPEASTVLAYLPQHNIKKNKTIPLEYLLRNVHYALQQQQERPWTASEPATPVQQGGGGGGSSRQHSFTMGDDDGTRNDAAFHAYLWAMMQKHPRECRRDWKVVQRCLQLSLRLSTKLRNLPLDHPLQSFCKAVSRNFNGCRGSADPETAASNGKGVGNAEAFPYEGRDLFSSRADGQRRRASGSASRVGGFVALRDLRLGGEEGGWTDDDPAWERYAGVVQQVVSLWCRDADAFDLDPLWLLSKLRTHKSWHVALQVCAAVTSFWEESEEHLPQQHNRTSRESGFGLTLVVFDTLADACFVSFNDGDTDTLASALGAMWAADGALRRVFSCERQAPHGGGGDAGGVSPGGETFATASPTLGGGDGPASGESGGVEKSSAGSKIERRPSLESRSETGSARGGGFGREFSGSPSRHEITTEWTQGSRMVDVVRNLAQRCRGLPTREEEADASDGVDAGDGDRAGSSTGGIGASMRSEEEPGGVASWPLVALSLLELAEAVLNAVGPEATGDVLEACPQVLESMPPEFFRELADRQAMMCQQEALEATLLRQVTAEVWFAHGTRTRARASVKGDDGGGDDDIRTSPLGPRLAWLACEELTSFFQHSANAIANARLRGGQGLTNPAGGASPLGRLQHSMPHSRFPATAGSGLFGDGDRSRESGGTGGAEGGGFQPPCKEQLVKKAIETMGLNLILPGSAHRGAAFEPDWPCGFCDLALSLDPDGGDSVADGGADGHGDDGSNGEDVGLAVKAYGHGFHARCLVEGMPCRR